MPLSAEQLVVFRDDILTNTDPVVVTALANNDTAGIADWYNGDTSPGYYIYRGLIPPEEMAIAIELADVANMVSADVERLVAFFTIRPGGFFSEKDSERAGFDDVLSAAAANQSQQEVEAIWRRWANNLEEIYAVGVGEFQDPSIAGYFGTTNFQEVRNALLIP